MGFYLDNVDFEIGLVGFSTSNQEQLFLDCFKDDLEIFESPASYISNMDMMLNFSEKARNKYDEVIKNHTDIK